MATKTATPSLLDNKPNDEHLDDQLRRITMEFLQPTDVRTIPPKFESYCEDLGYVLSLAMADETVIARCASQQRIPLRTTDLPADAKLATEFTTELENHGFQVDKESGMFRRSDQCLFIQHRRVRDHYRDIHKAKGEIRTGSATTEQVVNEANLMLRDDKAPGSVVMDERSDSARGHATPGLKLRDQLRELGKTG
jgi:hypothetical protein